MKKYSFHLEFSKVKQFSAFIFFRFFIFRSSLRCIIFIYSIKCKSFSFIFLPYYLLRRFMNSITYLFIFSRFETQTRFIIRRNCLHFVSYHFQEYPFYLNYCSIKLFCPISRINVTRVYSCTSFSFYIFINICTLDSYSFVYYYHLFYIQYS